LHGLRSYNCRQLSQLRELKTSLRPVWLQLRILSPAFRALQPWREIPEGCPVNGAMSREIGKRDPCLMEAERREADCYETGAYMDSAGIRSWRSIGGLHL